MYNQHFGLERAPFKITPDTRMFYAGGGRGQILEALVYAITSGEGIIKVVGEVGTGKTMICRMLERRLPENVELVYLANPRLDPQEIHYAIAMEMGLDVPPGERRLPVLHAIQERLLEKHARGEHVVVLVEEAQSMPLETLEEIRLLSNLETQQDKLLQMVLFGQPELDERLADPAIRQLRERITHSFHLDPFAPKEIREYVEFRLRSAGYRGRDAFQDTAYSVMARASQGLLRRVNILADKALLAAYAEDTHDVERRHVRKAIDDSQFARPRRWGWPELALAGGVLLIAAAVAWVLVNGPRSTAADIARLLRDWTVDEPGAAVSVARAPAGVAAPAADARDETAMRQAGAAPAAASTPAPEPAPAAGSAAGAVSAPALEPAAASASALAPERAPASASTTTPAPPAVASEPLPSAAQSAPASGRAPAAPRAALARAPAGAGVQPAGGQHAAAPADVAAPATAGGVAGAGSAAAPAATDPVPVASAPPAPAPPAEREAPPTRAPGLLLAESLIASASGAGRAATQPAGMTPAAPRPANARASEPAPTVPPASPAAPEPGSRDPAPGEPDALEYAAAPGSDSLLDARLSATRSWLRAADRGHYSIQLLLTDVSRRDNLEAFLRGRARAGELGDVFVYQTVINSRAWFGVLYREYATYTEAREALERLPPELSRHQPFIRNVRDIASLG